MALLAVIAGLALWAVFVESFAQSYEEGLWYGPALRGGKHEEKIGEKGVYEKEYTETDKERGKEE